ncbi:MAG: hypothetical protein PVI97_11760 [Candidatus Thiodiazotropha sp.]
MQLSREKVKLSLVRPGFYPIGASEVKASVHPCRHLTPPFSDSDGSTHRIRTEAILSRLPEHIAQCEAGDGTKRKLNLYCEVGQRGLPAEVVTQRVVW